MATIELLNQPGIQHRAASVYRTLFRMGLAVVSVVCADLRHQNAGVRSYCCALLDHFLAPEALSDLIGTLRAPAAQERQSALRACVRPMQAADAPPSCNCGPARKARQ
ncbi:MAG: hypothetical protein R3C14_28015 [Caldilineaceae bacterium]